MTRFLSLNRVGMIATFLVAGITSTLRAQIITTFDLPGATSTQPTAINSAGKITGIYRDSTGSHGFVRDAQGTLTVFDAPNNDQVGVQLIGITSMNAAGQITGYAFMLARSKYESFVREDDGTFTVVQEPSECQSQNARLTSQGLGNIEGIGFAAINNSGQITGICGDTPPFDQSFLRQADGSITVFTVPVSGPIMTRAQAINSRGQVTGYYFDQNRFHGFLREPSGTISTFDAGDADTVPTAMSAAGAITGYSGSHGFLRRHDGTIETFDIPNSTSTQPTGINPAGKITGFYVDENFTYHGFVRHRDGSFKVFDVSNSTNTYPSAVNADGEITGSYTDASGAVHGFVRRRNCHWER